MKKYIKTLTGCTLSAALIASLVPVQVLAAQEDNYPTEKTETVFCVLNEDGTISSTTVSNHIHDEDGINNVKETIQLKNVESTKGDVDLNVSGNTYTWNTSNKDVYYQGQTDKQLPVSVNVKYYLNDQEVNTKDLEGKEGHLKCVITLNPTITKTVMYGNKAVDIHPAYLCGGALILNGESVSNLSVSQGEVVNEGDSSIISFVAIPGLASSLEQMNLNKVVDSYSIQDEVVIEGDINNCEIKTMVMGMTNGFDFNTFNSIDALSELTGGINELVNASNQITDGSKQLYDGTSELIEKSSPLTSAYPQIQQLAQSTELLDNGALQLKQGVIDYVSGSKTLNVGIQQINAGATQLAGSKDIANGMNDLSKNLEAYDLALQQAQAKLQNSDQFNQLNAMVTTSKAQLEGMNQVLLTSKSSLNELAQAIGAIQQLIQTLQNACIEVQKANGTLQADNQTINQYNSIINDSKVALSTSIGILQSSLENEGLNDEQRASLLNQISQLQVQYNSLNEISNLNTVDLTTLTQNLAMVQGILSKLDLTSIQTKLTSMETMLTQANGVLDEMATNIQAAQAGLNELNLADMVRQLEENAAKLSKGAKTLSGYMDNLDAGIGQLRYGISQINDGSNQLNSFDESLIEGVTALQNGTNELKDNKESFNQMADGLQQLSNAFTELNNGAKELSDGCQKFNVEGMQTLKEKVDLTTGELDALVNLFNQIIELNNENKDFIGTIENADVKSRYILRFE